ncbi:hypothetical protein NF556_00750 [Ornithinimicrobium faecis]|uniref:DUF5642 domain-containing protein n=1 Tax=Ornithinimicrobium faecis TaxID=2934158 RepID=A0ABY4YUI9_9MICO|nr:hypothetical protein [Ornithinimicrobium sp. HY1793]USQ80224.1 hypothetical protein NF556_00750 [Ornithinimicrobium sp. HY1793]
MRTRTMFALAAAATLTLSACGGGAEPLTQEQASEVLLTDADFPLEGFTAGTPEEGSSDDDGGGTEDILEGFPGVDQLSQECKDALTAMGSINADFTAQTSVEFTGAETEETPMGAPSVQVTVASMEEGDNPLDAVSELNSACEEVTIEEQGMEMTMGFGEVEGDADGTKITIEAMGQSMEMVLAGREDGGNYTVLMATGVTDDEAIQVLDAQDEKISEL